MSYPSPPRTPTPGYYYVTRQARAHPEEDDEMETPRPRRIFPGRVNIHLHRGRPVARHNCEREGCLLCLPYRE